jgi:hypothetical protein
MTRSPHFSMAIDRHLSVALDTARHSLLHCPGIPAVIAHSAAIEQQRERRDVDNALLVRDCRGELLPGATLRLGTVAGGYLAAGDSYPRRGPL